MNIFATAQYIRQVADQTAINPDSGELLPNFAPHFENWGRFEDEACQDVQGSEEFE